MRSITRSRRATPCKTWTSSLVLAARCQVASNVQFHDGRRSVQCGARTAQTPISCCRACVQVGGSCTVPLVGQRRCLADIVHQPPLSDDRPSCGAPAFAAKSQQCSDRDGCGPFVQNGLYLAARRAGQHGTLTVSTTDLAYNLKSVIPRPRRPGSRTQSNSSCSP